jgi:aspartyl-tRNA synthetase
MTQAPANLLFMWGLVRRRLYHNRTHHCGQLSLVNVGERVKLCGWVQKPRIFNERLMFIPLRDGFGTTQLVHNGLETATLDELSTIIRKLSPESVVCVEGIVKARNSDAVNEARIHAHTSVTILGHGDGTRGGASDASGLSQ